MNDGDEGLWTKDEYDRCPELADRLHKEILNLRDRIDSLIRTQDLATGECVALKEAGNALADAMDSVLTLSDPEGLRGDLVPSYQQALSGWREKSSPDGIEFGSDTTLFRTSTNKVQITFHGDPGDPKALARALRFELAAIDSGYSSPPTLWQRLRFWR